MTLKMPYQARNFHSLRFFEPEINANLCVRFFFCKPVNINDRWLKTFKYVTIHRTTLFSGISLYFAQHFAKEIVEFYIELNVSG